MSPSSTYLNRFNCAGRLFLTLILGLLMSFSVRAQLTQGEYAASTLAVDSISGFSGIEGCFQYEIDIDYYALSDVSGTQLYLYIDSIQGAADSVGVWHQNSVTSFFEGDSIPGKHHYLFRFYSQVKVFYSIKRIGTPMVANELYACELPYAPGIFSDFCNIPVRFYYQGNEMCTVQEGSYAVTNDSCVTAIGLNPGLNWVNNLDASGNTELEISCFDDNVNNVEDAGVWYTFTTPSSPAKIGLVASPSENNTNAADGAQLALFTACGDEPIACGNPNDNAITSLVFDCGVLEPNTTYFLLADGWQDQTGIYQLEYLIYQICDEVGCTDQAACNYNPFAGSDDGSCLYGNECLATLELQVDTTDCHNYTISVSLGEGQLNEMQGMWYVGDLWYAAYDSEITVDETLGTGLFTICYYVFLTNDSVMEACTQLFIPENCDEPCEVSISTQNQGCFVGLNLNLPFSTDSTFLWDFGNGETAEAGTSTFAVYSDSGTYSVCVDLNFYSCEDTTVCRDIFIPNCESDSIIYGCTDPDAVNYDPQATTDDGSCIYQPTCEFTLLAIPDTTDPDALEILVDFDYANLVSVLWDFGDGTTSTEFYPSHTYIDSQVYELCCTATFAIDSATCTATACTFLFDPSPGGGGFSFALRNEGSTGIFENTSSGGLTVWPNPTDRFLTWQLDKIQPAALTLKVYSISGKLLKQVNYDDTNKGTLSLFGFKPGVYFVSLSGAFGVGKSKFVVIK